MSLKREKLLHIGKSFLFLREGEELAHSSLSLTINWKAEKETVISFVKNMYVEKPFRSTGRAMWWWSAVVVRAFGPLSILPAAYANYQAFFLIPVGILPYDLSVPTKTIFSRYPDTLHCVKCTYASISRASREIFMHMYQLSTANSGANQNENKIN